MESYEPPDRALTEEEQEFVSSLAPDGIKALDAALIWNISERWQKVAKVVVTTMLGLEEKFEMLPDVYFSRRIRDFVAEGLVEARGDLSRMRYSEVRTRGVPAK